MGENGGIFGVFCGNGWADAAGCVACQPALYMEHKYDWS